MIASTCSVSYHWRAMLEAMSGLFWWSASTISIGDAQHLAAEILDRHLGGLDRRFAAEIGIDAGLVVQDADLDLAVRYRVGGEGSGRTRKQKRQ